MAEQDRSAATQMAGLAEQVARIEAKLDALIEALAEEDEGDETAEIVTMDGQRMTLPTGGEWL